MISISDIIDVLKYILRTFKGKTNLLYSARKINIRTINGECDYLELHISNVGNEPYLLKTLVAKGKYNKSTNCPWQDGFSINYENNIRIVPRLIEPGSTFAFPTWPISVLERNQVNPNNEKTFYDPWCFFILISGANQLEFINVDEVLFKIDLTRTLMPHTRKARGMRYAFCYNWYKLKLLFRAWIYKGKL